MRVRVITPTEVVLDMPASHVTVEDVTGSLGIRPGHLPLVSALETCILMARDEEGTERFVALDAGVLLVHHDTVTAASPRAVVGDDLEHLEKNVLELFRRETDEERAANIAFEKLKVVFLKRLFELGTTGGTR